MRFDIDNIIPAPREPARWEEWRAFLWRWRTETLAELRYDGHLYRLPEFEWVTSCFCCGFVMLCDETFYDHRGGRYTVQEYLAEGRREFGGYDAVVLWQAYPNIGFDDRNQFDYYRDLPGGIAAIRAVSDTLHAAGVRVFITYNPWDTGTRREPQPDLDMLVEFVAAIDADGIFLDTMREGSVELRAALDAARPGVVLEAEGTPPIEQLHDHHMSWGQWFTDSEVPGVLHHKWLEPRHMQHQIRRWDRDHSGELQTAWMNGSGMMVWENVFGSWNGWNARDRAVLRSMLPVQRRFSQHFSTGAWTPLVQTERPGAFASLWEHAGVQLWTVVNRTDELIHGPILRLVSQRHERYFDLIAGDEIRPVDGRCEFSGDLIARGFGAYLAIDAALVDDDLLDFLARQAALQPLLEHDTTFPARVERLQPFDPAPWPAGTALPDTMVAVEGGSIEMEISYRLRECGFYDGAAFVDAWFPWHPVLHGMGTIQRSAVLAPYAIDRSEVTNREFQRFMTESGYRPGHDERFLAHWENGMPLAGEEDAPVVYVDLDDARAYCRWRGRRLPTEYEWQYALEQGIAGYGFRRVWNWTESERSDGRTRYCILKGGADYRAEGSVWYVDGLPQAPSFSAKFLLMWPGLSRCATIGFRCAVDLPRDVD